MTEMAKKDAESNDRVPSNALGCDTPTSGASALGRMLLEETLRSGKVLRFPSSGLVLTEEVLHGRDAEDVEERASF